MRRAIIHVGMPRTASTTIQHVLAHLRPALAGAGILYPALTPRSAADEPHISHQHLGEALDGRRPAVEARELLDDLARQLAATTADVVILSYEDWIQERRAFAIGDRLNAVFASAGFRTEVVVVVKPQSEHLNSIYSHRAQLMRERRLFAAFCRGFESSHRFAYAELLEPWWRLAEGRVQALPLRDKRSAEPLINRFLAAADVLDRVAPLLAASELRRVENRSPGPVAVETSRRLRLLRVPARLAVRPRVVMRDVERLAFAQGLDSVPFKGVDPALRERLSARYAATNDRFARLAWQAPWDEVVAPEPPHAVNEIGGRPIAAGTEGVIAGLMSEVGRQYGVVLRRPWHAPLAEWAEDGTGLGQRVLRLSKWRVI
jgi:hypothetical protein